MTLNRREPFRFLDPDATLEISGATKNAEIILNSARTILLRGVPKFSVADVVRMTGLSRATIYNYFGDRDALLAAVIQWAVDCYHREITHAMRRHTTLLEQAVEAIVFTRQWRITEEAVRWGGFLSDAERALLFTRDARVRLEEGIRTFSPFIREAGDRGEIRQNVNVEHAAEWLARIVGSFAAQPGVGFDHDSLDSVRDFVRPFILDGMR